MQLTDEEMKVAKMKYKDHAGNCCSRIDRNGNPIEMRLTFDQWLDIWLLSGHWHERGRGKGQYVMSRFNDTGHYEISNVEIKTAKENIIENKQSPKYRENQKLGAQKRLNNAKWQEKNKIALQQRCNKQISCDGVIYESQIIAALALAPETRLTEKSKKRWIENQLKKFPNRYFYITESE